MDVLGDAGDRDIHVRGQRGGVGDLAGERGVGTGVVIAHHHHHAIAHQVRAELLGAALEGLGELRGFGRAEEAAAEEVAEHHVLGEDPAAVGGLPPERRAIDRGGHAAPHHRPVQAAHVAGSVASGRCGRTGRACSRCRARVRPRVRARGPGPISRLRMCDSPLVRNSSICVTHGPTESCPDACEPAQVRLALGPAIEVVVDHRGLTVEVEMREPVVAEGEERVHHLDEPLGEDAEGFVPFTIPMRVRDQGDGRVPHGARVCHGLERPS